MGWKVAVRFTVVGCWLGPLTALGQNEVYTPYTSTHEPLAPGCHTMGEYGGPTRQQMAEWAEQATDMIPRAERRLEAIALPTDPQRIGNV